VGLSTFLKTRKFAAYVSKSIGDMVSIGFLVYLPLEIGFLNED